MTPRARRHGAAVAVFMAVILAQPLMSAQAAADIEREARAIDAVLIAPCCFRQQVSVHQSPAADDVRLDIRARLTAGETRQQILDAYVARYGKRILVAPPAAGFDLTLYVMPVLALLGSALLVAVVLRRFTKPRRLLTPAFPAEALASPAADIARLDDELRDLD